MVYMTTTRFSVSPTDEGDEQWHISARILEHKSSLEMVEH